MLPTEGPETTIGIDTPAGRIVATAFMGDSGVGRVSFRNVPSFVVELDLTVELPAIGTVRYDLAFGGGFYAYVDATEVGLTLAPSNATQIIEKGRAIKKTVMESMPITHPADPDLGFLYGVIFVGPPEDPTHQSRNVCVFADGEVDRSPTGTGVSGRLAIHHARAEIEVGEKLAIESILGSVFTARIAETTDVGGVPAVIPEVAGTAHITGRSEVWLDPHDPLGGGFFIR
jgi:trans-L-3-hydroxyproline dehydratase